MMQKMFQIARYMRPRKFQDVIGQDHVVQMVHNSLLQDCMLPVCILYGPSGVGKTTIARLIAMWFCCENLVNQEPCGECAQCMNIINDTHPDVFELDGGAYTGVDDIRAMLSNLEYQSILAKKKIYILDEAHMLSKSAITCLLKRFEEPMDNVQFILATTDIDKIPETIISRSFHVGLSSVTNDVMLAKLKQICDQHDVKYEDSALELLVKYSHGSVRQALSSLEQANVFSSDNIALSHVERMFGLVSRDLIADLIKYIIKQDTQQISSALHKMNCANPINAVSQVLQYINTLEKNEYLLNFAYDLAESALILHKAPFAKDMLEICILRAVVNNSSRDNLPQKRDAGMEQQKNHDKSDANPLFAEARKIFDLADDDKSF